MPKKVQEEKSTSVDKICFLCLSDDIKFRTRSSKKPKPEKEKRKDNFGSPKILLSYLTKFGKVKWVDNEDWRLRKVIEAYESEKLQLCSQCRTTAQKLIDLHLQLEAVQMHIIDALKEVKRKLESWPEKDLEGEQDHEGFSVFNNEIRQQFLYQAQSISDGAQVPLIKLEISGMSNFSDHHNLSNDLNGEDYELERRKAKYKVKVNLRQTDRGMVRLKEARVEYDEDPLAGDDNHESFLSDLEIDPSLGEDHDVVMDTEDRDPLEEGETSTEQNSPLPVPVVRRTRSVIRAEETAKWEVEAERRRKEARAKYEAQKAKLENSEDDGEHSDSSDYQPGQDLYYGRKKKKLKLKKQLSVPMKTQKVVDPPPTPLVFFGPKRPAGRPRKELINQPKRIRIRITKTKWRCDICLEMIPFKELKDHLPTHPEFEKFYYCDDCPTKTPKNVIQTQRKVFGSFKGLVWHQLEFKHNNIISAPNMTCLLCPPEQPPIPKRELPKHLYEFHKLPHPKPKCTNCSIEFYDPLTMQKHFEKEHMEKTFICESCPEAFSTISKLNQHSKTHLELKCTHCPRIFKTKSNLDYHEKTQHMEQKMVSCEICGKEVFQFAFDKHKREFHSGKVFKCKYCGKVFKRMGHVRRHEQAHRGEAKYKCDKCDYVGTTSYQLLNHKRLHGELKFACEYCPKKFTIKRYLEDHIRTHTKETPFICEVCGQAFNARNILSAHRRKKHKIAPVIQAIAAVATVERNDIVDQGTGATGGNAVEIVNEIQTADSKPKVQGVSTSTCTQSGNQPNILGQSMAFVMMEVVEEDIKIDKEFISGDL